MDVQLVALALVLILLGCGPAGAQDADTLRIDGKSYRLHGVDAPEADQVCLDAEGQVYGCGRAASEALQKFVAGRTIRCDDLGADSAYPRRRIGHCFVDGVDLHVWLIQHGWALNFEPYAKGRFKADEEEARAGQFGLWKGCFVAPQDFRRWNNRTARLLGPRCPEGTHAKLFPDDPRMPSGCEIKGKYSWRALPYRGIYHAPGCGSYQRTVKPDRWFCSEDDALAANFRRSFTCWW